MIPSPNNAFNPSPGGPMISAPSSEEKNWAMGCHLSSLCGFLGVPFGNILGPLVIWLIKKDSSAFINEHGRESLNFHISLWIYGLVSGLLFFTVILIPLMFLLWGAIYIGGVVYSVIAGVKAANGEHYRYPLTLRLIS
ncbi:DUF4870 domain-containing protein [Abditibacterium utsteinense]|nr:DUF4870 domain-containing protein [Abditibacterium utsteinense]